MYSVSNAFKEKMRSPIQEHRVTGTIGSLSFSEANIVEGSFSISNQSTDSNDVVLGSCYVGQLNAEFTGINILYGDWINKVITPTFALNLGGSWESVPLGVFTVKEAKHTEHGVQVTAYDNMIKFDKKFKKSHFMNLAGMTNIIDQLCTDAGVVCGMSHAQIEALPNGDRTGINIYGSKGKKAEFANDITTLRDLLFWVAQTLGCFATMNRAGQLEFRPYTQTVVDRITEQHRIAGATFADYITHYVGIYVENLDSNTEDYYGYDTTALQQELTETMGEITQDQEDITDLEADRAEWVQKLANHECTQQEYDEAIAEIDEQEKLLTKDINQLTKRAEWLSNAISMSADDGSDMVLGANPLTMAKNLTTRDQQRREILGALNAISYTPFQANVLCGCIYDLGDVIQFSGGLYNSSTDSFGCVMSYTYTHNGGTELEGFGVDPAIVMVRNKTQKSTDRASKNSIDATHNSSGNDSYIDTVTGRDGDMHVKLSPPIKIELHSNPVRFWQDETTISVNADGKYDISVGGYSDDAITPVGAINAAIFKANGFGGAGTYHIKCKMQFDGYTPNAWGCNNMGLYISYDDSGIYYSQTSAYGTLSTTPVDTFLLNMYFDNAEHEYSFDFIIDNAHASYIVDKTMYIAVVVDRCWKYRNAEPVGYASGTLTIKDLEITGVNVIDNAEIVGVETNVDGVWKNIDYVDKVSQTQGSTGGTEIAEINNTNGTKTKIYQKTVEANPTGTATETLQSMNIGGTLYELGGGNVDDVKVDNVSVVTNKVANINSMTGATAQAAGTKGLVPAPASGDNEKFLRGDGTWQEAGGGGNDVGLSVVNGAIDSTYDDDGTDVTADILKDSTGDDIVAVLDSIAYEIQLLGQPEVYAPVVYSEEEREIGVWTDGKPLYQKTFNVGALTQDATKDISISDLNIETCVKSFGYTKDPINGWNININDVTPSTINGCIRVYANLSTKKLFVNNGSGTGNGYTETYITIQYTKTTDTPGSGHYAALGVPAVHYSENEQVIGTWIDGKTVYQKTFKITSNVDFTVNTWVSTGIDKGNMDLIIDGRLQMSYQNSPSLHNLQFGWINNKLVGNSYRAFSVAANNGYIILQYTKTS